MIKRIDHFVITTGDIEKCISFYEKLGFESNSSNYRYELFNNDFKINVHIKGQELHPHARNVQTGSADLCFEVYENILHVKKDLEEKGIKIELGPVQRFGFNGEMESIYFRDPDGNLIEFCNYL